MVKEEIFNLKSPYRDNFKITAFRFGSGEKTVAIAGSMRGDEVQQQFICSQIVKNLITLEENGLIKKGKEILVIPCANNFSLNINKRFWAMDNTDINRMFPGYEKGETTQRIAAALFDRLKNYKYGIHLASFYIHGDFIPHVRVLKTGYEDLQTAASFGLPYIILREPSSFDTALLSYNWQIFGTKAYSLYSGETETINKESAKITWLSVLRFLHKNDVITYPLHEGYISQIVDEKNMLNITTKRGGILYKQILTGTDVKIGDTLAKILDPFDGSTLSEIKTPVNGSVFFSHQKPLVSGNTLCYRIIKYDL